jgi:hypothetical protein
MLLRDEEILELLTDSPEHPALADVDIPVPPFGRHSPIQPSSLDLNIGKVFLPDAPEDGEGGMNNGSIEYWLEPGHTAVVVTKERLHFPPNIAGFGFPPTRISANAVLMTNPGHSLFVEHRVDGRCREGPATLIQEAKRRQFSRNRPQ